MVLLCQRLDMTDNYYKGWLPALSQFFFLSPFTLSYPFPSFSSQPSLPSLFICFVSKKVERLADQLEKLWVEMERPEKQNVAELGKQKGSLCSLFSESFESGCATGSTWESRHPGKERIQGSVTISKRGGISCRKKEGRKLCWRAVRSERSQKSERTIWWHSQFWRKDQSQTSGTTRAREGASWGYKITTSFPSSCTVVWNRLWWDRMVSYGNDRS